MHSLKTLAGNTAEIVDIHDVRHVTIWRMAAHVNAATIQEKNIIIETRDPETAAYEAKYRKNVADAFADVDTLIRLADDPSRKAVNEDLKQALSKWAALSDKSVALGAKNDDAAAFVISANEVAKAREVVMDKLELRTAEIDRDLAQAKARAVATASSTTLILLLGLGAGLLAIIGFLVLLVLVQRLDRAEEWLA